MKTAGARPTVRVGVRATGGPIPVYKHKHEFTDLLEQRRRRPVTKRRLNRNKVKPQETEEELGWVRFVTFTNGKMPYK